MEVVEAVHAQVPPQEPQDNPLDQEEQEEKGVDLRNKYWTARKILHRSALAWAILQKRSATNCPRDGRLDSQL